MAQHLGSQPESRRCLTATTSPSAALASVTPVFTNTEWLASAGFLAGYSDLTRPAYELDLRQYASWCQQHRLRLFAARRADIGCFARDLEARGRAQRARLAAGGGRTRPAFRARADLAANTERAANVGGNQRRHPNLGVERGHRTLVITRKGGKVVTIPLAPPTARAMDLAVGEPLEGPIFLTAEGRRLDRHGAARIVRRAACRAGIVKRVGPHTLRHACITAASPVRQQEAEHSPGPSGQADQRTERGYHAARAAD